MYERERKRGSENSAQAFPVFPWPMALLGHERGVRRREVRGGTCGSGVGGIIGRLQ